jgi:N-acyl-D-amino-acid deacylase
MSLETIMPAKGKTWKALSDKDLAGRLRAIEDADFVARLVVEADRPGRSIPPQQLFSMGAGDTPEYTAPADENLAAVAERAGEHWVETFLRLSKESGGTTRFTVRQFNSNLSALSDVLKSERMFPILGDAGAHVSQIMDAGWSSFVLSHWVRDQKLFTMGEAIRRMTSGPARIIGLTDRGTLAPGMRADVNVFDANTVTELQPEIVHDFPGGAPRYIQRSRGYLATLVNGQVNVRDGKHTGTRAGAVLRHQA